MSGEHPLLSRVLAAPAPDRRREEDQEAEAVPAADAPYRACSRRSNRPEFSVHFITPAGVIRSFQYAHLDSGTTYTAECVTLTFMGLRPWRVVIRGRNLRGLYEQVHQHRATWVRQAPEDFAEDGEPIVSQLEIAEVKESD